MNSVGAGDAGLSLNSPNRVPSAVFNNCIGGKAGFESCAKIGDVPRTKNNILTSLTSRREFIGVAPNEFMG
jgi:hypothetical protein